MGGVGTQPAHEFTTVTEQVAVKRAKGTTWESELGWAIVRQQGVSVLQKGDENEPVVYPCEMISD